MKNPTGMKLKIFTLFVILTLMRLTTLAEGMAFEGTATDDITHQRYDGARVEIVFNETSDQLKLLILPTIEAMHDEALVDTVWKSRSYYREAPPESTDFFEERKILFLYNLEDDKYLESYTVFSQFIDKQNKDIKQIVIRKFDAEGHRRWCMSINANSVETDAFFKLLQTARKKLRFRQLTKVMERPDPNVKHRPVFEDNKVSERNHMHGGNPYGSSY